ncbi:hypothetical protein [Butyrivibrio sp. AE2015]|uniref:hypothetical protein n=1 Tax=Butyrivibrio sp. AE2015 TaxID=1280663 RepID=UPI0003B66FE5|nr:hypothetical protein [Butyrivibrio sp. AE2015]
MTETLSKERKKEIVHSFMNMTFNDIKEDSSLAKEYGEVLNALANKYSVAKGGFDTCSFMELVQFMNGLCERDAGSSKNDQDRYLYYWSHYQLLLDLLEFIAEASNRNTTLRIFTRLSIKEFYEILENDNKAVSEECDNILRFFKENITKNEINKDTKLIDVIMFFNNTVLRPWLPHRSSITDFMRRTIMTYEVMHRLFIDSFMITYPEAIDTDALTRKYLNQ